MPIMCKNSKIKLLSGDKIKKIYCQNSVVYSSGNIVTYICNGQTYLEEVEEGASVLNPNTFTPSLSGATFLGWSLSAGQTNVLTEMIMNDEPITLYGVFKYNDIVLLTSSYGSGDNCNYVSGPYNVDPNKYTFWLYTANYGVWERSGAYSDAWQGKPHFSESKDEWNASSGAVKYISSYANGRTVGEYTYYCPDCAKNITPRGNTYITWEGSNRSYSSAKLIAVGKVVVS